MEYKYSVAAPVYNEGGNIKKLHEEIVKTMDQLGEPYEIVFVNDGSSDNTLEEMKKLSPLKIVSFRRNYGQTAATDAGFQHSSGEIVITMDSDLQNPPSEIPKLLNKMQEEDLDVVSGWRSKRKDTTIKRFISRGANLLRKILINDGIHDSGCSLKTYRQECLQNLELHNEMHRFIPALLKCEGFKVGEVEVEHRAREHGETKYNWKRTFKGFIDMISVWFWKKYTGRPLHLFGGLGGLSFILGATMAVILIALRILKLISLQETVFTLTAIFLMIIGIQLFITGLLADMIVKNHYSSTKKTHYNIKEIIQK